MTCPRTVATYKVLRPGVITMPAMLPLTPSLIAASATPVRKLTGITVSCSVARYAIPGAAARTGSGRDPELQHPRDHRGGCRDQHDGSRDRHRDKRAALHPGRPGRPGGPTRGGGQVKAGIVGSDCCGQIGVGLPQRSVDEVAVRHHSCSFRSRASAASARDAVEETVALLIPSAAAMSASGRSRR